MVLCCRAVQGIKKDKKRIKEAGPFAAWLRGLPFLPTNHLQHLLPGDFAGNTVVLSVHGLREIHRNRIGKVSETCKTERSELPPLPCKFLIFPLPFLIFSRAPEQYDNTTPPRARNARGGALLFHRALRCHSKTASSGTNRDSESIQDSNSE